MTKTRRILGGKKAFMPQSESYWHGAFWFVDGRLLCATPPTGPLVVVRGSGQEQGGASFRDCAWIAQRTGIAAIVSVSVRNGN